MFKDSERAFEAHEEAFEKLLLAEIERLAKAVIGSYPRAKSFCMAMGTASFHCEWAETDGEDTYECDQYFDPHEIQNDFAIELDKLLEKWNDKFHLTGCPMRIDRDHVTRELVTTIDW